jgi:hypothetical protein
MIIHFFVALSCRHSVISITAIPTSSHLVGVKMISPVDVSKCNPLGGLVLGFGVHLIEVGGMQYGVIK